MLQFKSAHPSRSAHPRNGRKLSKNPPRLQRSTLGAVLALTLATSGCGDAFEEPLGVASSEIVNGQNASPNEWPWQIALRRNGDFQCGGVILNSSWVLTAAHCVWGTFVPRPISEYTITAGDHILSLSSGHEQQRTAAEIIVHPNWGTAYQSGNGVVPGDLLNDVALIRVNQPFTLNQRVKAIPLSGDNLDPGTEVWATGWGLLSRSDEDPSDVLQEVQSAVVEPAVCANVLGAAVDDDLQVEGSHICMGRLAPNLHSACSGDSGGPLVVQDSVGNWSLVGITSWGSEDCDSYAAYGHVRAMKPWIESVISGPSMTACNGRTIPGKTRWFDHVFLNGPVAAPDTSACGTPEAPGGAADGDTMYFTSLGGNTNHWLALGANTLFDSPKVNFSVRLELGGTDAALAESRKYHLNWEEVVPGTQRSDLCAGRTPRGSTAWQQYNSNGIYVDVNTTACGFSQVPAYFTALASKFSAPGVSAVTSIYPRPNGFRVFLRRSGITVAEASANEWHVNWQAVPYGTNNSEACVGRTNPNNTPWVQYGGSVPGLYVDVDTTACGESYTPNYLTSLGGTSRHWAALGVTSIYSPTPTGFRVYLNTTETVASAQSMKWHVNWKVPRN